MDCTIVQSNVIFYDFSAKWFIYCIVHAMMHRSSSNPSSCISDCVGMQFGTVRCAVVLFNCYSGGRSALNEPAQLASSTIVECRVLH